MLKFFKNIKNHFITQHQALEDYKATVYENSMVVAEEFGSKLGTWVDSLKGISSDPDSYFPYKNFAIIYKLQKKNRDMTKTLAEFGKTLRNLPEDQRKQTVIAFTMD